MLRDGGERARARGSGQACIADERRGMHRLDLQRESGREQRQQQQRSSEIPSQETGSQRRSKKQEARSKLRRAGVLTGRSLCRALGPSTPFQHSTAQSRWSGESNPRSKNRSFSEQAVRIIELLCSEGSQVGQDRTRQGTSRSSSLPYAFTACMMPQIRPLPTSPEGVIPPRHATHHQSSRLGRTELPACSIV